MYLNTTKLSAAVVCLLCFLLFQGIPSSASRHKPSSIEPALAISDIDINKTRLRKYDRLEIGFRISGYSGNPYDDNALEIWGVITTPDGGSHNVPGFYMQPFKPNDTDQTLVPNGRPLWKIRYTPTRAGAYSVVLHAGTRDESISSDSYTVEVSGARAREAGFVRIHPRQKKYFQFGLSKKAFFPFGYDLDVPNFAKKKVIGPQSRYNALWGDGTYTPLEGATDRNLYKTLKIYEESIVKLANAGGNSVRLRVDSRFLPLELKPVDSGSDQDIAGWLDVGGVPGFDIGRYHQGTAWIVDRVMRLAEVYGIRVQFCTWNENQSSWISFYTKNENEALIKRRLRYQVARWGYSTALMSWELFNEATKPEVDVHGPFWTGIVEWLRNLDVHRHLINNTYRGIDYDEKHNYFDHGQDLLTYISFNSNVDRPLLLSEFGKKEYHLEPVSIDPKGYKAHEGLWACLMRGWSGAWYWWYYPHVYWGTNFAGLNLYTDMLKGISSFLAGEDLGKYSWKEAEILHVSGPGGLTAASGMVGNGERGLLWFVRTGSGEYVDREAVNGNVYKVWADNGAKGFKPGTYRVEWWDTWTGGIIAAEEGLTASEGKLEVSLPDGVTRDVAAKVIKR